MDYHDHLSVMDFNELICENLLDVDYGSFKEYYELNELGTSLLQFIELLITVLFSIY